MAWKIPVSLDAADPASRPVPHPQVLGFQRFWNALTGPLEDPQDATVSWVGSSESGIHG